MDDIQKLQTLLTELDDQLAVCMRCGMCQSVCPVFTETMLEGDVARGKLALVDSLAKHMVDDAKGVKSRLEKCLLCGSCEANCPSGVKVTDIFIRARAILTGYIGLSPIKQAIFKGGLSHPALFSGVLAMGTKFQGLFTSPANEFFDTTCSKLMAGFIGDRHIVPLADRPLHKEVKPKNTPAGKSGLKVAFYPGCVVDKIYTRIGKASLKVLDHYGVGVYMPGNQGCCGIPALASGDTSTFEKLVKHNVKLFEQEDFDVLITPCATCTSTIKKLWPRYSDSFTLDMQNKIESIASRTMDISEFLVDRLGVTVPEDADNGFMKKKVTWHDPCHLKKSLGVANQPRTLLKAAPGYEFTEMTGADSCCGSGGSFNVQHYETSKNIGTRKQENIVATGAVTVSTGCPGCMMQLTDMLSQNKRNVEVKHVIEIFAERLN